MDQKPKQLKFQHQPATDILNGTKTTTFRFFDDKNIRVGDSFQVVDKVEQDNPASWEIIGIASVVQVVEKKVRDVSGDDWIGHKTYVDTNTFIEEYNQYYKQTIDQETPLKIIHFSFTKYGKSTAFLNNKVKLPLPAEVKLFTDGGSRGNPGPSAGGFVVKDMNDVVLRESSKYLGITTNNQAEYHSLKGGIELCLKEQVRTVHIHMDSLLVVNQIKGIFKVKNRELWSLHDSVVKLLSNFGSITITHIPRELNRLADAEVNKALDALKEQNRL
ncbi:MAG: reverse transcriptase-like protein [bacterium]